MEPCYDRYVERLVVTNVALFLFIMEFLLLMHICFICTLSNVSERQGRGIREPLASERRVVPIDNIPILSDSLQASIFLSIPYIILMIFLPLILSICFKDRKKQENFNYWNNVASCGAAFLVCFMGSLKRVMRPFVSTKLVYFLTLQIHLPFLWWRKPVRTWSVVTITS